MFRLKIKPLVAKGSHAGVPLAAPAPPQRGRGCPPDHFPVRLRVEGLLRPPPGPRFCSHALLSGTTSCFSPQRILHHCLSSQRAGGLVR